MRIIPLFALVLAPLAACTVGPDFERPVVAGANDGWTLSEAQGEVVAEPWRALNDPVLTELVEAAMAANLDIRQADARLREARAGMDAAAGGRLPQLRAGASAARQQLSENGQLPIGQIPGVDRQFPLFDAGFDASWEIDLWGGARRAVEAAGARSRAAEAMAREARLRIVAEVERGYAELRGAQAEETTLQSDAEAYRRIAMLMRQSYEAGEIARSDGADAMAAADRAQAALPAVRARIRAAIFGLALLTGRPPEAWLERLSTPAPLPAPPERVGVGLRSELLRRRPDIIAAEAQLAAATADVGVETARLFPQFSLIGGIGQQGRSVSDLGSGGSTMFQVGPSLSWPIFSGGRIRAQVRAAKARADGAAAAYEQAVLGALTDSETALNRYNAAVDTGRLLGQARVQSAVAMDLAGQRYRAGEDSLLQMAQAIVRDNAADRAAIQARMQALQAHGALVKALGGGWAQDDMGPATRSQQ